MPVTDDGYGENRRLAARRFRDSHPERAAAHRRDFESAAQIQSIDQATRRGDEWTERELELVADYGYTARQVATMTGRTFVAVKSMRKKLNRNGGDRD